MIVHFGGIRKGCAKKALAKWQAPDKGFIYFEGIDK